VKHKGLGKGLDALFIDNQTAESAVSVLKISEIEPNREQPRIDFGEAQLNELADSIRLHGVLQPIVVRPLSSGGYQIVAGERRWRASRIAGETEIPVIVRELDDLQVMEIAIIENLQREDLNVIELANGYKSLMDKFGMTQEQIAEKLGKSRPVIANTIRLLNLPQPVVHLVREGKITGSHAKALLAIENTDLLTETAERAAKGELLVRDIERIARQEKNTGKEKKSPDEETFWNETYRKEVELALTNELGRKIIVQSRGERPTITIELFNDQELSNFASLLTNNLW